MITVHGFSYSNDHNKVIHALLHALCERMTASDIAKQINADREANRPAFFADINESCGL